jgi:hypothetical protein
LNLGRPRHGMIRKGGIPGSDSPTLWASAFKRSGA